MTRLVYGCRFRIPSTPLNDVLAAYSDWIVQHYRTRRGISDFACELGEEGAAVVPDGHELRWSHHTTHESQALVLEWNYPDDNDKGLRWRSAIRLAYADDSTIVEHAVFLDSLDYRVSPAQFSFGSPGVIRTLCSEQTVFVGEMRVQATAYPLESNGTSDLIALLTNPVRRLPIVLVTPYANGDENLVDAERLARRLAGVAVVVNTVDTDATWALADELGRTLSCFDGGVRIYWPSFAAETDPRRCPLYVGQRISAMGAGRTVRAIERLIFGVSSFRFAADPKISDIVRAAEHAKRSAEIEAQRAAQGVDWEQYALELDSELTKTREQLGALESEVEILRANQQVFFGKYDAEQDDDVQPDEIEVPDSVLHAVEIATARLGNLIILDSALDSAKQSPFNRPADVLDALSALNEISLEWRTQKKAKGSGGDIRQKLIDRGFGKRCSMHISDTTRTQFGADYTFNYDGARRLFEPHLTLGSGDANSCASVHFILDDKKEQIVVAHVGRHLPNTKK